MITITGKPVCSGVAFGPVFVFSREESTIKRHHIESSDDEIARFESARQQTISELAMLYDKALAEVGEANAMIFQIHQMMLDDLDYIESIKNIITDQLINAETAVAQTCDNFVQMFRAMDDPYMRERSADVKDVSERLIKILSGKDKDGLVTDEPVIIISDDLAPSETVQFDKSKILAFVTEGGSTNSHTSILARMMNIPAMIGAKGVLSADANGKNAIVDGFTGTIYIDPDEATINEMTKKKEEIDKSQWNGIAVYVDHVDGEIHPVTYELIGKARELASKINHPVYALFMGNNIEDKAEELLHYGVDKVFVYDFPELARILYICI